MSKKINLKSEKAKRNLEYALRFKKRKKRTRDAEPSFFNPAPSVSSTPAHAAVCHTCGVDTTVPFKPTQGRPVLCRSCFQKAA